MIVKDRIKSHPDVVDYFKKLPFFNKYIEKPKVKRLKSIDLLSELPLYEELSVLKTDPVFRGHTMSYKVEIVEKKDPIKQLEASITNINNLIKNLLDETKGFKYEIALKVMLKKYRPVYLN